MVFIIGFMIFAWIVNLVEFESFRVEVRRLEKKLDYIQFKIDGLKELLK